MSRTIQETFGLSEPPEFVEMLTNEARDEGLGYRWKVQDGQFPEIVQFILDEQRASDMRVVDATNNETLLEIDNNPEVRGFDEVLLGFAGNLSTSSILSVNFEEPPVNVHLYAQEAVVLTRLEPNEEEDHNLIINFTVANPPAWLRLSPDPIVDQAL